MALSKNTNVKVIDDYKFTTRDCVAGALHIYSGALLNSNAAGNVLLSTDADAQYFAGVAIDEVEQASTASIADNTVQVIAANSGKVVRLKCTSVTKADIGKLVYASADDAVTLSEGTYSVVVGRIMDVDVTNYCFVKLINDLDTDTVA
jgi:hypothetical protein